MKTAKAVFFPLDEQLELIENRWSEGLVKEMVWLSGVAGSYEEAEEIMTRIGHIQASDSTIWRRVKTWGAEFEKEEEEQREQATNMPHRGEVIRPIVQNSNERKGASMDGGMVHIKDEGWKELKVGCVYDIQEKTIYDKKTKEWLKLGRAVNNSYVAYLGEAEIFGQLLWNEAQQRSWEQVYDTQIIGDGAHWIWNLSEQHFYDSLQTVDWYHASQHLHQAAHIAYPQDDKARQRWLKKSETLLFQGHAQKLAQDLQKKATDDPQKASALQTEAGYFDNNKRRMQYLETREQGYPIGSGTVESGVKQFKARFNGPGMRWSREGIQHLIPIRSAILSHRFDAIWDSVYPFPKN